MPKPSHCNEAQATKKVQPKPQPAPQQAGGELALAEAGVEGLGFAQGQAARLGDLRLNAIQRQKLASQIGQV